jgi:glycosyltransferase involved in cell wall biosynthesis
LQAFSLIYNKYPNTSLFILGDGEQRTDLEKLSLNLGLCNYVHFLGLVEREYVYSMMLSSNMIVLASKEEGNPRVIIEAMASGLPIVATNVPGIKEMIKQGQTGLLITNQDSVHLANGIEFVIRNRQEAENIAERAYSYVIETFAKEEVSKKIRKELQLYF